VNAPWRGPFPSAAAAAARRFQYFCHCNHATGERFSLSLPTCAAQSRKAFSPCASRRQRTTAIPTDGGMPCLVQSAQFPEFASQPQVARPQLPLGTHRLGVSTHPSVLAPGPSGALPASGRPLPGHVPGQVLARRFPPPAASMPQAHELEEQVALREPAKPPPGGHGPFPVAGERPARRALPSVVPRPMANPCVATAPPSGALTVPTHPPAPPMILQPAAR